MIWMSKFLSIEEAFKNMEDTKSLLKIVFWTRCPFFCFPFIEFQIKVQTDLGWRFQNPQFLEESYSQSESIGQDSY